MLTSGVMQAVLLALILVATACQSNQGPSTLREGDEAPGFTLRSADGQRISLSDYRDERAVLLYFSMGPG